MRLHALTAADLDALMPGFVTLFKENVDAGASIGYHPPMPESEAERFWRNVQDGLRCGERVVFGAFDDAGALVGTGQLSLEMRPNGRHRAEVQKVLVAPAARRQGIARAIMLALEDSARASGRRLLLLDTREGDVAARLYESLGYELVGRVPHYVLEHDGATSATMIFVKWIGESQA
jgi:ribosomal protein S18 acetylase RimI-like enzyme